VENYCISTFSDSYTEVIKVFNGTVAQLVRAGGSRSSLQIMLRVVNFCMTIAADKNTFFNFSIYSFLCSIR